MKIFKRLVLLNGECDKFGRWETIQVAFIWENGALIASNKSLIGVYV